MKIAIFDFDRTLSSGYSRYDLAYKMEADGLIKSGLRAEIETIQRRYEEGEITYNEKYADDKAIFTRYYEGLEQLDIERFIREKLDLESTIYDWSYPLLESLRERGYFTVLLSGSWDLIMERAAEILEVDTYWGTQFEVNQGVLTGGYKRIMTNDEKRVVSKQLLYGVEKSIGLGDSTADLVFLTEVTNGFAINAREDMLAAMVGTQIEVVDSDNVLEKILAVA